jgi:hypothetical protein
MPTSTTGIFVTMIEGQIDSLSGKLIGIWMKNKFVNVLKDGKKRVVRIRANSS